MHLAVINHGNNTPPISTLSAVSQNATRSGHAKTKAIFRVGAAHGSRRVQVVAAAALRKQLPPGTLGLSKTRRAAPQASPLKSSGSTSSAVDRRQQIMSSTRPCRATYPLDRCAQPLLPPGRHRREKRREGGKANIGKPTRGLLFKINCQKQNYIYKIICKNKILSALSPRDAVTHLTYKVNL